MILYIDKQTNRQTDTKLNLARVSYLEVDPIFDPTRQRIVYRLVELKQNFQSQLRCDLTTLKIHVK